MRDWIVINGKRVIWEDFVGILDYYRYKSIIRERSRDVRNQYNYMLYVLQELACDYHEGSDYVLDHMEDFITRHYMKMPKERRLPEALEELFNQMQARLHIDLSEMLDECVQNSQKTYQDMQDAQKRESERLALIRSLSVKHSEINSRELPKKVSYLMHLQKAKTGCKGYKVKEQEIRATGMWCELLIRSLSVNTITNGLMKRAVENDILSEIELSDLLRTKCHIDTEYEKYAAELSGLSLDEPVDIYIKDFLELCEPRFREILGIREEILGKEGGK
ncbi:MAG: hypothetical protein HFH93_04870 [Lachnospiraceae bacterium]|nr:hypothetical protein [Lachnospiraceae bacterium]